jgi:hypothetical protein
MQVEPIVVTYFSLDNASEYDGQLLLLMVHGGMSVEFLQYDRKFSQKKGQTELLGLWTFSIVWYSREHDVSLTESVSVLR